MELWRRLREHSGDTHWLVDYLLGRLRREAMPADGTVHVLFMIADHWEPSHGGVSADEAASRVRDWLTLYPRAAAGHQDADGCPPRHTFFYPVDQYREGELRAVADLAAGGYGEVEVHLHHGDDTSASLARKLDEAVCLFRREGCLGSWPDGQPAFGFVHGDWALDNSRQENGRNYCGVDDELRVLARGGCFADFTFPAFGCEAQPRWVNRIMRVTDDPARPRSHERGAEASVGGPREGDLVLISGPMIFHRSRGRLRLDDGNLTGTNPPRPERMDAWIRAHVHVRGRPEWIFVKAHTHGCADANRLPLLTRDLDRLWTDLERRSGDRFRLHYVTAREAYNIVRAAEDGKTGDPGRYRDYEIAAPCSRAPQGTRLELGAATCEVS